MKRMGAEIAQDKANTPLAQAQHRLRLVCVFVLAVSITMAIYLCISVGYIGGGMWGVLKARLNDMPLLDSEGWLYYSGGGLEALAREMVLIRADLFLVSLSWALSALWGMLCRGKERREKAGMLLYTIALVLILRLTLYNSPRNLFALTVYIVLSLPVLAQLILLGACLLHHRIEQTLL